MEKCFQNENFYTLFLTINKCNSFILKGSYNSILLLGQFSTVIRLSTRFSNSLIATNILILTTYEKHFISIWILLLLYPYNTGILWKHAISQRETQYKLKCHTSTQGASFWKDVGNKNPFSVNCIVFFIPNIIAYQGIISIGIASVSSSFSNQKIRIFLWKH